MKKQLLTIGLASVFGLGLTGCAKNVDLQTSGATKVAGTSNLYKFCDGPTAIYFSSWSGQSDEYEFIVYDGCSANPSAQTRTESIPDDDK